MEVCGTSEVYMAGRMESGVMRPSQLGQQQQLRKLANI